MVEFLSKFRRDESGATAIEYSLIAAFIATGLVTVLGQIGADVQTPFANVADGLKKRQI